MTKQHADMLTEVLAWLEKQPDVDPLALGVMADIQERVAQRAKDAAVFRVRLLNKGTSPSERARQHAARMRHAPEPANPLTHPEKRPDTWRTWQADELATLARLWREGLRVTEIAEQLGRSVGMVSGQIDRMHLFGTRAKPVGYAVHYRPPNTPLARAKQVMDERRKREALTRREEIA